jgi:dTDP-4-dehydrorhamnose 3,5-epimerase
MKFISQKIQGVYLIKPELHEDKRGVFRRSFCQKELEASGVNFNVRQGNISENFTKHTLRGFHYQSDPSSESKILTCLTGSLFNVIIDLRSDSETFHNWIPMSISAKTKESVLIPAGCSNAFLTMSKNTIVHYYMSEFFQPESYHGIRYNDPYFSVSWPSEPKVISEQDLNFPDYKGI